MKKIHLSLNFLSSLTLLLIASSAHAQITYDNLGPGSSLLLSIVPGGATAIGNQGRIRTGYILDRLTTINPGALIGSISFSVVNEGATSVDAGFVLAVYDTDGAGGAPGTRLYTAGGGVRTYAPGERIITGNYPIPIAIPASGDLWIGLYFDNFDRALNTNTSATIRELNELGLGIYNAPTIGSSADNFFVNSSGANTSGFLAASNPSGTITSLGGTPVSNIGFRLGLAAATAPEPSSLLLGALGLFTAGIISRRRQSVVYRAAD
jgi:hypothetical protein